MDSGNSGSLQSSSGGGDDDFDSRGGGVDSSPLSALLRPTPSPSSAAAFPLHAGSLYGLQDFTSAPPHQHHQAQQQASWSSPSAQFMAGAASSSSSQRAAPADAGAHHQAPPDLSSAAAAAPAPPRGSRKRARASRRAPTTVLNTDTSNFRAMVQEFTGIPNPPFGAAAGAPFGGTRFDHIFSSASSAAALRSAADPAASLPPYLLRPFAQKLNTAPSAPSPFASFASPPSSTSSTGGPNANVSAIATAAVTTAASINQDFQLPSSALLRMQQDQSSSYLSFQNLLGSTQPTSQQHMFGGMSQSHGAPRMHDQSPSQLLSGGGMGLTHGHGGMMVSEGMHMHHQHQHQQQRNDVHQGGGDELSGLVRAGASGSSCKLNYTSHAGASSSSAAATTDAPPDGVSRPGRGEGLDPWLCTSE